MTSSSTGLIVLAISSLVPFVLGYLVRVRGPRGLVNSVDWDRVSDPDALGRFVSNIMYAMGLAMLLSALAIYVAGHDSAMRNLVGIGIAAWVTALTLTLLFGIVRYQDKPAARKHDGR